MSNFNPTSYIAESDMRLREFVGNNIVLATVSGGVDSSVSAALLKHAGIPLKLLYIDTGFQRKGEREQVIRMLNASGFDFVDVLDIAHEFYAAQKGMILPADKREAFRQVYFNAIITYITQNSIKGLVQGTQFHKDSKVGHNTPTEAFMETDLLLVEPVKGLYKDQIRMLARELELSHEITQRRPFPGPGLLIRFGGEYTPEKLHHIREATAVVDAFVDENREKMSECYQIFPYLYDGTDVRYINEKGPSLDKTISIRAVRQVYTDEGLIYAPFEIPYELLQKLVVRLMNVPHTARVTLDFTPKNFTGTNITVGGTIEYQ